MAETSLADRFRRSMALVVGIDRYTNRIDPLRNAVSDARTVGKVLKEGHGYEVLSLLDEEATRERLMQLLCHELPAGLTEDDRLLVYFAGHGAAITDDEAPQGFLLPHGAAPGAPDSYLPMRELHDALVALPCRHMLLILDCCFAGTFRWSSLLRKVLRPPPPVYRESYDRFVGDPAWQVITSAGADQPAFDALSLRDHRGQEGDHSPFAAALLRALDGAADAPPQDGLITATELYLYLRNTVEPATGARGRQTPGLWPLRKHDKGEFLFKVPGRPIAVTNAPPLSLANNPYRGLEPFTEDHRDQFYGRGPLIQTLVQAVLSHPLTVLTGASGSGKSSLIRAGLIPALRQQAPTLPVLGPIRPTATPLLEWQRLEAPLAAQGRAGGEALLVVDQGEELISLCADELERQEFLRRLGSAGPRVLLVFRSDFEPHLRDGGLLDREGTARLEMPPLQQDELREIIERPAAERALYFEPSALVDRLINDVLLMPGALPLLSFTLSELYRMRLRRPEERTLTEADYTAIGGVAGALTRRASAECDSLIAEDALAAHTVRRVLLRMVAAGGQLARRRVMLSELDYGDVEEDRRVARLLERLIDARLLVLDQERGERCVEPAHDALVSGWDRLVRWRNEETDLPLQRLLWAAAQDWDRQSRRDDHLWDRSPRLPLLRQVLQTEGTWLNRLEAEFVRASLARKRRLALQRAGIIVGVFLVLLSVTLFALKQRDQAIAQGRRAQSEARIALSRQLAAQAMRVKDQTHDLAALLSVHGRLVYDHLETRTALRAVVEQAPLRAALLHGKAQPVGALAVTRDGRLLAVGSEADGIFDLYDLPGRRLLGTHTLSSDDPIRSVAISPDQRTLALGRSGGILLWDLVDGQVRGELTGHPGAVTNLLFQHGGAQLLAADWADGLFTWDLATRRPLLLQSVRNPRAPKDALTHIDLTPDGLRLIHGRKNTLALWRLDRGEGERIPLPGGSGALLSVAIEARGALAATGHFDGSILLWDLQAHRLRSRLGDSSQGVQALAFSPDGAWLCAGRQDGSMSLYEVAAEGVTTMSWPGHRDLVTSLAFTQDGQWLISGAQDGSVVVWDLMRRRPFGAAAQRHSLPANGLRFSPDSRLLATGSADGSVRLWDVRQRRLVGEPRRHHKGGVLDVDISPDGRTLASAGYDRSVSLTDVTTGAVRGLLRGHEKAVSAVAFSPRGDLLASAGWEGAIVLWDLATQQRRGEPLKGHKHTMSDSIQLDFSPDGRLLAGSHDQTVLLWDVATGKPVGPPLVHEALVSAVRFRRDGKLLAVASDSRIWLWELPERRMRPLPLRGHRQGITSLSFAPDGQLLLSTDGGGTLLMWDVASGQLAGPPMSGSWAEVSPDGLSVAVAQKEQVSLIELDIDIVARRACEAANRNLSLSEWQLFVGSGSYCRTCPMQPAGADAPADAPACAPADPHKPDR